MLKNQKIKQKSLYDLGLEYERHAEMQNVFIKKCEADLENAKQMGETELISELTRKRKIFKEIRKELLETARKLKTYYKGDSYGE